MSMETVARCCLICAHFDLDMGMEGYSELTPGSPAEIRCEVATDKRCAWPQFNDDASPRALRSIAERCPLFEVHPAVAKEPAEDWKKSDSEAWTRP